MSSILSLCGQFPNPFADEDPAFEYIGYRLVLEGDDGRVQLYSASLDNGVTFTFTWNSEEALAVIKRGAISWYKWPEEATQILHNVVGCAADEDGRIPCFVYKRYDEYVSVSRVMNAIIGAPRCLIRISKYSEEELKQHHDSEWLRMERKYTELVASIQWPDHLAGAGVTDAERFEWLKREEETLENGAEVYVYYGMLLERRHEIEQRYIMTHPEEGLRLGSYWFSMDTSLHGPYDSKEAMLEAIASSVPECLPSSPYMAYVGPDGWISCNGNEYED